MEGVRALLKLSLVASGLLLGANISRDFVGCKANGDAQSVEKGSRAMAAKVEQRLVGTWLHSHEEDTDDQLVYRPKDFDFPPARGRRGYEFLPDHTCNTIGISPRDGAAKTSCTWQLLGGPSREIVLTFPGGRQEKLPLLSVDRQRLVVRKTGE
jgi:hypothetical protein